VTHHSTIRPWQATIAILVYTPAGYDAKQKQSTNALPAARLGDDSNGWIETGMANVILDNLIAQVKRNDGDGEHARLRNAGVLPRDESDMLPNYARTLLEE